LAADESQRLFIFASCVATLTIWKSFRHWNKFPNCVPATEQFFMRVAAVSANATCNLCFFYVALLLLKERL
jgi:hypothetical protein